jgi:hypothetical protein
MSPRESTKNTAEIIVRSDAKRRTTCSHISPSGHTLPRQPQMRPFLLCAAVLAMSTLCYGCVRSPQTQYWAAASSPDAIIPTFDVEYPADFDTYVVRSAMCRVVHGGAHVHFRHLSCTGSRQLHGVVLLPAAGGTSCLSADPR